jgi:hypothetical protein
VQLAAWMIVCPLQARASVTQITVVSELAKDEMFDEGLFLTWQFRYIKVEV